MRLGMEARVADAAARFMIRLVLPMAVLLLGACAGTPPTRPSLLSLPGTGKTLEQFNADDAGCRQYAAVHAAGSAGGEWTQAQRAYDYAYVQCMFAKGHKVPVPGRYTSAPPAGAPPPPPPDKPDPALK